LFPKGGPPSFKTFQNIYYRRKENLGQGALAWGLCNLIMVCNKAKSIIKINVAQTFFSWAFF